MSWIIAAAQSASVKGDVAGNVARHLRLGRLAAEMGAQLLVFPELSLTGYELEIARDRMLRPNSAELEPLRELAVRARMTVTAGAPVRNDRGELLIAALVFRPDGGVLTHSKVHVHSSEEHVFAHGPGGPVLSLGEARVGLGICADASHPEHAAQAASLGADVYAVGAMIEEEAYARKAALLSNYALAHRMAVLLANYSGWSGGWASAGKSAIWSEDGEIVAACAGTEEALIIGRKEGGRWSGEVVPVSAAAPATGS